MESADIASLTPPPVGTDSPVAGGAPAVVGSHAGSPRFGERLGEYLQRLRVSSAMSLSEVSRATRIPTAALEAIEADQFESLPGDVFVKGFLRAYARAVGANADEVLALYHASRRSVVSAPIPVAAPVEAARPGHGKRFGVAIAFVLILILFTLALSIVLKPRGRDVPAELSMHGSVLKPMHGAVFEGTLSDGTGAARG
jgi:hypothetical protein